MYILFWFIVSSATFRSEDIECKILHCNGFVAYICNEFNVDVVVDKR